MVSLPAASMFEEDQGAVMSPNSEATSSNSKKRKSQELGDQHQNQAQIQAKQSKRLQEQVDDIELNLANAPPLPLEWQRCLDIKSGQIHFYNIWTHKRTSEDPRLSSLERRPPSPSPSPTLDLELNLNSSSSHVGVRDHQVQAKQDHRLSPIDHQPKTNSSSSSSSSPATSCSPSWISLDVDRQEMVAAVCMRCHVFVMMCKAAPSCPNCKFVHPLQGQTNTASSSSSSLISNKQPAGLRLLCCKD